MNINELLAQASCETWAIRREYLTSLIASAKESGAAATDRRGRLPRAEGNVAVIPITGTITQRGSVFDDWFGGTSTQAFEAAFQRAVNSDRIGSIVLDVDSPGGTVAGVQDAADRVFAARGRKMVVAVVNSDAHSAAYWIASSAERFVAARGSSAGSIGVFRMHEDISGMLDGEVKITFIATPEFKVEGNPFEPLSKEAFEHHMDQVQATYDAFNRTVARNRGVTPAHARDNFGRGRSFSAEQAVEMNLVDRVASMTDVLRELGVGSGKTAVSQAADDLTAMLCESWESGIIPDDPWRVRLEKRRLGLAERETY